MARVEIPIGHRILRRSGDKVLRAELDLELKTQANTWEPARFRFDPGTEMTTMPADQAKSMDLPMPRRPVLGLFLHGQEVRAGLLRARVVGTDPTEVFFPCYRLCQLASPWGTMKGTRSSIAVRRRLACPIV
jgi:hypothetical protein